jgi:SIR2-like domain
MHYKDAKSLAEGLSKVISEAPMVLFAGAGVSARANLPVWSEYLGKLADSAGKYESETADLMRKRISSGLLLDAAGYFKSCAVIPEDERFRLLAAPFEIGNYDFKKIIPLCSIPFKAIATTNYDRSLLDASSQTLGRAPQCAELDDSTLRLAPFWRTHYIARIHGRAEVPRTIVLDRGDYDKLYENDQYEDFLKAWLTQNRCLFIGFSFLDPAILRILSFVREKGTFPRLHHAVLPLNAGGLAEELAKFNIDVLTYDCDESHSVLWDAIELVAASGTEAKVADGATPKKRLDIAKRLLAVCYARVHIGNDRESLRDIVIEGIVLSEITKGISTLETLTKCLKAYMAVTDAESRKLISAALDRLCRKQMCMYDPDQGDAILVNSIEPQASPAKVIADGILSRLAIREKFTPNEEITQAISSIVEEIIVLRGFDLGAEFSGADLQTDSDVFTISQSVIEKHLPTYWQDRRAQIAEVFRDLVKHPDEREEATLGELGRLSFGIELVLQAGRATMYALSLPEIIYLDASVLMPAIVPGHPNQSAYENAIIRLQVAAKKADTGVSIQIPDVFLDEIVNHRMRAIDEVTNTGMEDLEVLRKRIVFYGADRLNVYLGGYASWVNPRREDNSFELFLSEVAPYTTVAELKIFLRKRGFAIADTKASTIEEANRLNELNASLQEAFAGIERADLTRERKAGILIRHEAQHLNLMERNQRSGKRQLFVTADRMLKRMLLSSKMTELAEELITPRNLVQLVDLLIGVDVPAKDLMRLLWSMKAADQKSEIKDYFINRALRHYNAALLMKMGDMLDAVAEKAVHDAKLEKVKISSLDVDERIKTARFMDRVEEEAFAQFAVETKKLEKHIKHLEGLERKAQ